MSELRVEIDGRSYRLACGPGEEERLGGLAADLDATVRLLRTRLGEIGDRRIMVMAALTVLDRLKTAEDEIAELSARSDRLERSREAAVLAAEADDDPLIDRLDALAGAIDALTAAVHRNVRKVNDEELPLAQLPIAPSRAAPGPEPQAEPEPEPDAAERPVQVGRSYGSLSRRAAEPTFGRAPGGATDDAGPPRRLASVDDIDAIVPTFTPRR